MKKTWNEFWGEFLLVQFHKNNPARWSAREKKAKWIVDILGLPEGSKILDLGCGDGLLDICLGRLGMNVTGVDRLEKVLDIARQELKQEQVEFLLADIRELQYSEQFFDAIIILEVLGLMSKKNDTDLIARSAKWLKPGASIMVDCPREPEEQHTKKKWDFSDGQLSFAVSYQPESHLQEIVPRYIKNDGTTIELYDPYDSRKEIKEGLQRYLYPVDELMQMIRGQGLLVEETEHFSSPKYYTLIGRKTYPIHEPDNRSCAFQK